MGSDESWSSQIDDTCATYRSVTAKRVNSAVHVISACHFFHHLWNFLKICVWAVDWWQFFHYYFEMRFHRICLKTLSPDSVPEVYIRPGAVFLHSCFVISITWYVGIFSSGDHKGTVLTYWRSSACSGLHDPLGSREVWDGRHWPRAGPGLQDRQFAT